MSIQQTGTLVREFSPYRPDARPRPVYDRVDAYYFPVSGFDGIERPGPLVRVYRILGDLRPVEYPEDLQN